MRLPASVQELADVIGTERALFLIGRLPRCFAGIVTEKGSRKAWRPMLYVPTLRRLTVDHQLVRILGWPDAEKLCRHFGGEILQPANCAEVYRPFRDQSLRRLHTEGVDVKTLAEWFGVSERTVKNALAEIPQEGTKAANDNYSATIHSKGAKF